MTELFAVVSFFTIANALLVGVACVWAKKTFVVRSELVVTRSEFAAPSRLLTKAEIDTAIKKAIKEGAENDRRLLLNDLCKSPTTRKSIGL